MDVPLFCTIFSGEYLYVIKILSQQVYNSLLFSKDNIKYAITIPNNKVKYWKKFFKEYDKFFETYKFFKSNRNIYKQISFLNGYELEGIPLLDEDYEILLNKA